MQGLMQQTPLLVTKILDQAAKFHGEQELITRCVDDPTAILKCTYKDVHRRAQLFALALRRLVQPGDRIATLAWNTIRHMESWYSIAGIGAIVHTLNPRLFTQDLEYIINHAEDSVIITDSCFIPLLEKLAPTLPTVKHYIVLTNGDKMPSSTTLPLLCYEDLLEAESDHLEGFKWNDIDENQACGLCYTSGTTGHPKGVLYSHRSNVLHSFIAALPDGLCLSARSRVLLIVPLFHANSWGLCYAAPLVGASVVFPAQYLSGESVYQMLENHQVTVSAGVPTVWMMLADYCRQNPELKFNHTKLIISGGSAAPRHLIEFYQDRHVEMLQLWGMTELSPLGTYGALDGVSAKKNLDNEGLINLKLTQGRAAPLVDMRIVDDEQTPLPHDGVAYGDLQVRGPHVISSYYKRGDEGGADDDSWFSTGDVASINPEGWMKLVDRTKDLVKSGGEWISSIEIENIACGHAGIQEAAVIAIPDERWGERPLLVCVKRQSEQLATTQESILEYLSDKMAKWWLPERVVFVDAIPHTATGKISKLTLRNMYANGELVTE